MSGRAYGYDNMVAFAPYGDQAKRQKKLMQMRFGLGVARYNGVVEMKSRSFLTRLVLGAY